jgi:hypothetical protein
MTTTIAAALLTIAIASVLLGTSSHMGLAFAAKKIVGNEVTNTMVQSSDTGNTNSPNTQSDNTGDSSSNTGGTDLTFSKDLKKFSKCLTGVAADGDLTLGEVTDCYHQVF